MTRTRYKIFEGDHFPYFLTLTTVNWLPLFSNPSAANFVFDSLGYLQSNNQLIIYAYVLMENHLHLVASGGNLNLDLSRFKSYTARKCIDLYINQNNEFILKQLAIYKQPHRSDRKYHTYADEPGLLVVCVG
jgi:REP element-mobilizing transposase RayT